MKDNKKGKAGKNPARVPAKKVIGKIDRKIRSAPPQAKFDQGKLPQRKPNKAMSGKELLAKGMAKVAGGHS